MCLSGDHAVRGPRFICGTGLAVSGFECVFNMEHSSGDLERFYHGLVSRSIRLRHLAPWAAVFILCLGGWSLERLRLDVTPDIGSVQVQVLTAVPGLAPEEAETSVTRPIELEMAGLPGLEQTRSITRFGVSQVTLTFSDQTDLWRARQMVAERLGSIVDRIPKGMVPKLGPPSAGLGEVFSYALVYRDTNQLTSESLESRLRRLKTAQDFIVKPYLRTVKGIAEVNTTGGYDRQLVVGVDPKKLPPQSMDLTDVANLVERNLSVGGGALLDESGHQVIARSRSRVQTLEEFTNICVRLSWGAAPISLNEVAHVEVGSNIRLGAATLNGKEAVIGTALMLFGENARTTAKAIGKALDELATRLPPGMQIVPLYDRSELVDGVIGTVGKNLAAAAVLVVAVLLIFLGNGWAAMIVALLLCLSFALGVSGMAALGVMGSLFTLGAIDFGVVVDDSIVLVENVSRALGALPAGSSHEHRLETIRRACGQVRMPMLVGMLIIMAAYLPLLGLGGLEGKMFHPLAIVILLILGSSLVLTITLVPAFCALFLSSGHPVREPAYMALIRSGYGSIFRLARRFRLWVMVGLAVLGAGTAWLGSKMETDFLPYLDEGSLVIEVQREPEVSLAASLKMEIETEQAILKGFPEIKTVYSRIGVSDIATDPQGANQNDIYLTFKPQDQWRKIEGRPISKPELSALIREAIERAVPGQELEFNQPIGVRFDEMLEGVRTDVAIKLYGPDYEQLDKLAGQVAEIVKREAGIGSVVVDQSGRNDFMEFYPARALMLQYQVTSELVNNAIAIGLQGREVGRIDDGDQFYPVVVRIDQASRADPQVLNILPLHAADGTLILGLGNLGRWVKSRQLAAINREQGSRREAIFVTLSSGAGAGVVERVRKLVEAKVALPLGYRMEWTGSFHRWESGSHQLTLLAFLVLVFSAMLVHSTLDNWRQTLAVASGIPFAIVGGVIGLWLRGLPITMPASVGFVTLAGLSLLNGLVLTSYYNLLRKQGTSPEASALEAARTRFRPVLMTALVAGIGFVPMAVSQNAGAELQRPFATVVLSGIMTASLLTLIVVPILLEWTDRKSLVGNGLTAV